MRAGSQLPGALLTRACPRLLPWRRGTYSLGALACESRVARRASLSAELSEAEAEITERVCTAMGRSLLSPELREEGSDFREDAIRAPNSGRHPRRCPSLLLL